MKFTAAVFAVAAVLLTPAFAADAPQLVGTWKGAYVGAFVANGFLAGDYTLVVAEQ
jgi:opacity protein-like surface antigen